jgi:aminopeptidase N
MKNCLLFLSITLLVSITPLAAQTDKRTGLMKNYDVKYYNLDLEVSNTSSGISGNVMILSDVVSAKLDTFVVELINNTSAINYTYMIVDSVKINNTIHSFFHKNDLIITPLINPVNQGQQFTARIFYHGLATAFDYQRFYDGITVSRNGIIVVQNQKQSFSMSESRGAKIWWPCKQDLTDKADSVTFYITTDKTNLSGSNGNLRSIQYLPNGKVKYKWETKHPIDYYLISFVVGRFSEHIAYAPIESLNDSVRIQSLLNINSPNYLKNIRGVAVTKSLINIYSGVLGNYPFKDEKYGYCAVDTSVDGMENQTMTTINSSVLDTIPSSFSKYYTWVSAHELAHQWFGDYVTCSVWNDIWINEGFATYMEYIALQKMHLNSLAKEWIYMTHSIALQSLGSVYIPDSELNDDSRIFNFYLSYKKGASIIHTLRYEINNDSLFFKGLKDFLSKYSYSVASASDFKNVMETTTGLDLNDFFNQWYYGEGYPVFNIRWFQNNDTLKIESNQTTNRIKTPLFKTHFDIRIKYSSGDSTIRLYQDINNQVFKIPMTAKISSIEFDPDEWILKRVEVSMSVNNYADNSNIIKAYPNPFNESTELEYYLNNPQTVKIEIYNLNGVLVEAKIINGVRGENYITTCSSLNIGIYLYRIHINGIIKTGKLIKL